VVEGDTVRGRPVRLFLRRSRLAEADADAILAENIASLRWLERYFDMRFPFAKLDLLLAPAFPFGGMEHVGLIFYNESRFIFREEPTESQLFARAATIHHEIAHQWFGDLVTMAWFDDLWLKEAFATFAGTLAQDALHPDVGAWARFHLRTKPPAYVMDATSGTTPVWQELPNLDAAKGNYGPIVYNKAPSVLRQLELVVGADRFRDGVRLFLRRHAYGAATWQDLLTAIGEAAGRDLSAFGQAHILRAGIPVVETRLHNDRGRIAELALSQRPARMLPGDHGGPWPMAVRVRLGYERRADVVLDVAFDEARTVIAAAAGLPAPDYVLVNDGDHAYAIFLLEPRSATWLLANAGSIPDRLQRAMAWTGLWELVREGRLPPDRFVLAALDALPWEGDEAIADAIISRTLHALDRYIGGDRGLALSGRFEALLAARADAPLPHGLRKGSLDALVGRARTAVGADVLREYLMEGRLYHGEPLGQASRWAAVRRLLAMGHPTGWPLYEAEVLRDTTPEGPRSAFVAGAAVPAAETKHHYYTRYFHDETLNEEWVTASLVAFNEPLHARLTLPYLTPALEAAEWLRDHRRIFFLPGWIDSFVAAHHTPEALAAVDAFLAANPELPADVTRRVLQARDELERTVRIRGAHAR
jgi:aminopeptidase N